MTLFFGVWNWTALNIVLINELISLRDIKEEMQILKKNLWISHLYDEMPIWVFQYQNYVIINNIATSNNERYTWYLTV